MAEEQQPCEHRYLTSYGKGWVCANRACGVGILSLAVPLPMPLVEEALRALGVPGTRNVLTDEIAPNVHDEVPPMPTGGRHD